MHYGFSMLSRVLGAWYIHISNYKLLDSQGTIEKIAKEAINDADFIQSTVKIIRLFAESGPQDAELRMDSHFAAEFPEVFDIKKLIVLGEIGPEIAETYAAFGAEIRTKIAGFS